MTDFGANKEQNAANPSITNPTTPSPAALDGAPNRGFDNAFTSQSAPPLQITLETIDSIVVGYLRNRIAPTVTEDGVLKPVEVIYGTPERWVSVRKDGVIRDPESQKILKPLIALRRIRESRDQLRNPVNPYMYETLESCWNPKNAYDRFAVQNAMRPSHQITQVVVPDYMRLTYDVVLWADYQAQINQMIEQINFEAENYWGDRNNFKFRVMIEEYLGASNLPASMDRLVRSEFQMQIHAYLLPSKALKNFHYSNTTRIAYTPKKVTFTTTVVNQIPGHRHPKTPINTKGIDGFIQGAKNSEG